MVWQLFLSKFKFLRELLGEAGTPQAETQPPGPPTERSAAAASAARSRPRSARQRITTPEPAS